MLAIMWIMAWRRANTDPEEARRGLSQSQRWQQQWLGLGLAVQTAGGGQPCTSEVRAK